MRSTKLLGALAIVGVLCGSALGCASEDAALSGGYVEIAPGHCTLDGTGAIGAETFGGAVADTSGSVTGTWAHTTGTGLVLDGEPTTLRCRLNGARSATVTGTGTWNGVPGHHFSLTVLDNGGASPPVRDHGTPEVVTLEATRLYSPSRWYDGELSWADGAEVVIPDSLPVTTGNAGNQWARLTFVDYHSGLPIRCSYRGGARTANPRGADAAAGLSYEFARCEVWSSDASGCGWTLAPEYEPGVSIDASSLELKVQHGSSIYPSRRHAETTVSVDLAVTPYIARPGTPDHYTLAVFPDLTSPAVYSVSGSLTEGDLTVTID